MPTPRTFRHMRSIYLRLPCLCSLVPFALVHASYPYKIGVGKHEITDGAENVGLQGWADDGQRTKDREYQLICARAFVVEENGNQPSRIAMVVTDNWAATDRVKRKVLAEIGTEYDHENFMLMASHAHSAPGGYSDWKLYENQVGGFDPHNFKCIVDGIVKAVESAESNMVAGDIYINVQDITTSAGGRVDPAIAGQRSSEAYEKNSDKNDYVSNVDYRMWLLKFTNGGSVVGMLNWYALHPTSLGQYYKRTAGDSKGYAALRFEQNYPGVIAAFANSHAGDVSGNMPYQGSLKTNDAGYQQRMETSGNYQYNAAKKLFDSSNEKLDGPIVFRWQRQDLSKYDVPSGGTTSSGAVGYAFAAGSTEDGFTVPDLGVTEGKHWDNMDVADTAKALGVATALGLVFGTKGEPIRTSGQGRKPVVATTGDVRATPNVLPFQLFKIGQLAVAACSGELTTMAGRRLMDTIKDVDSTISHCAIAGYANEYSQYVTTKEEYDEQHYEGASTLYGPYTLEAYQDIFQNIAQSVVDGSSIAVGPSHQGTTATTNKRITIRNLCSSDANIEIFDKGDPLADVEECGWECNLDQSKPLNVLLCKAAKIGSDYLNWVCKVVQTAATPRLNAPKKVPANRDLVYFNVPKVLGMDLHDVDLPAIKIRLDGSTMIGDKDSPVEKGDMVVLSESSDGKCRVGEKKSYTPWWTEWGQCAGATAAPTIICRDVTLDADNRCRAFVSQDVLLQTVADDCDSIQSVTINNDASLPKSYGLGVSSIVLTASDTNNNEASCTGALTIQDASPPEIACKDITVDADDTCQAFIDQVDMLQSLSDNCDRSESVTMANDGELPSLFSLGTFNIGLTGTDTSGNQGSCMGTATVQDASPPTIACNDVTMNADDTCQAFVSQEQMLKGVSDNCVSNTSITVTHDGQLSTPFNLGNTPANLTASDASANHASCTGTVTVQDVNEPVQSPTEPICLYPPNRKFYCQEVSTFQPNGTDNCPGELTVALTGCNSDQPDDDDGEGDSNGNFTADCFPLDGTICFRAERDGGKPHAGRTYTATFNATDDNGNTAGWTREVYVPYSSKKTLFHPSGSVTSKDDCIKATVKIKSKKSSSGKTGKGMGGGDRRSLFVHDAMEPLDKKMTIRHGLRRRV